MSIKTIATKVESITVNPNEDTDFYEFTASIDGDGDLKFYCSNFDDALYVDKKDVRAFVDALISMTQE